MVNLENDISIFFNADDGLTDTVTYDPSGANKSVQAHIAARQSFQDGSAMFTRQRIEIPSAANGGVDPVEGKEFNILGFKCEAVEVSGPHKGTYFVNVAVGGSV